jgi:hypothetical protein
MRLRVISTSLLSILGFMALGLLLGFWLGTHSPLGRQALETRTALAAPAAMPNQKWCDPSIRCHSSSAVEGSPPAIARE